ncbi:MAG: hypothetical protein QXH91_01910 [Candidatus Bathyarchaeia archaeon]
MLADDYHKGWALRYIREAKDELKISMKTSRPMDFIVDAARKAQASIYYVLGDPSSIGSLVNELSDKTNFVKNPVLQCLVSIEQTILLIENMPVSARNEALEKAEKIVWIATEIINELSQD